MKANRNFGDLHFGQGHLQVFVSLHPLVQSSSLNDGGQEGRSRELHAIQLDLCPWKGWGTNLHRSRFQMHEGDNDWDQPVWIYYGRLGMAKLIDFSDEMTDTVYEK